MIDRFIIRLNNILSALLKTVGLGLLVIVAVITLPYVGVTVWGNIAIHQQNEPVKFDTPPSIATAPFQVNIKNTGEVYYAKAYATPSKGVYILQGYYAAPKGKWIYYKIPLPIDEYYWGPVAVTPRSK